MTLEEKNEARAIIAIKNYLNRDFDTILLNCAECEPLLHHNIDQIIENANKINSAKLVGVSSMREGNQSITFSNNVEAWSVTDDIRSLLPSPYIRMY